MSKKMLSVIPQALLSAVLMMSAVSANAHGLQVIQLKEELLETESTLLKSDEAIVRTLKSEVEKQKTINAGLAKRIERLEALIKDQGVSNGS
ncbi:hypothetical protein [Neptuniibacter sp. QD37_11]|uniref:hypothetical protein n=1 Tax=Neptuniibacter sp. QD37_11 TaxID=3398209 RepID=UPI0039F4AC86